jgi:hypothetical protein
MTATNRSRTAYVLESTRGTTPPTPAFRELRVTSNALNFTPSRVVSNEIRADRQITDSILTNLEAGGSVGVELSYAAFDDLFEAGFQGTWSNNPTIVNVTADTEISDVAATTLTVASGGTAFVTGMLALTTGFGVSANNRIARVTSSTGTSIVFPASTFSTEAIVPLGARVRAVGFEGASADIVATTTGGNALTSTALNFTTLGLSVGEWVLIGGALSANQFATAANNGWARISAIAASRLSFDQVPTGWAADAGSAKTVQIFMGDFLTTGTVQRGFTIERQQQDLASPSFEYFTGMEVDTIGLQIQANSIITGSFGFAGRSSSVSTTRFASSTDVSAPTFSVLNATSNVARLTENGVAVTGPSFIMELGFDLNNNLARQTAVGVLGAANIRSGEISLSGTLNAYFGDISFLQRVINDTETSLWMRTGSATGNRESYIIDIPRVKITGTAPVSGKNADRMFNGTYQAMRHATLGTTASISRFHFLPL